ncbi:MAG TPA: 2-phosphosulfolactate phosphatase [Dehalococcoidia bacterium]|nr:2-phosphosulfolactate phosphatase [Dehalococcoidia bacterium]
MRITVALTPGLLREPRRHAVAVVDVLRATTSLVAMFEGGLLRAMVSENLQQARKLALANFALLCGEVRAAPPPGFDYGNSPAEFSHLSFRGKSAVLCTTNGTRALAAAADAPVVAAAALTNRRAVAGRMVDEAGRRRLDIAVVCAGTERGTAFSLEDTAAAGAIVEAARDADPALALTDEAWAALHLWRWYRGDAGRIFRQSKHGRTLEEGGFVEDLRYAAQIDVSATVPLLYDDRGVKVLRTRRPRAGRGSVESA